MWWLSLTSAKALLSTQREFTSIHQIPKELPASWSLIQVHLQRFSHTETHRLHHIRKKKIPDWHFFQFTAKYKNYACFGFYLSKAPLVGMLRASPLTPVFWKYGMLLMLAAMTATESEGFTKKPCLPSTMLRSWRGDKKMAILSCDITLFI